VIEFDEFDSLGKFLTKLKVENLTEEYESLAKEGRYTRDDVIRYYKEDLEPSLTKELDEKELEEVVDYYNDIKKIKSLSIKDLNSKLNLYAETRSDELKTEIINSKLKDIFHMALNYFSSHKDLNIQDVVQTANLGLFEAVEKYDAKAKLDFNDYIIYYVRKNLKKEFEEKNNG